MNVHHPVTSTSSVLKSVDEILRDGIGAQPAIGVPGVGVNSHDPYMRGAVPGTAAGVYGLPPGGGSMVNHAADPYLATTGGGAANPHHHLNPHAVHGVAAAAGFDPVRDFSPINSDMNDMAYRQATGGQAGYGPMRPGPAGMAPGMVTAANGYDATRSGH